MVAAGPRAGQAGWASRSALTTACSSSERAIRNRAIPAPPLVATVECVPSGWRIPTSVHWLSQERAEYKLTVTELFVLFLEAVQAEKDHDTFLDYQRWCTV